MALFDLMGGNIGPAMNAPYGGTAGGLGGMMGANYQRPQMGIPSGPNFGAEVAQLISDRFNVQNPLGLAQQPTPRMQGPNADAQRPARGMPRNQDMMQMFKRG